MSPARLKPTAPIAADAILVGDPGRALLLAQELLEQPKMSNHARGLWGYGGRTAAGDELTIQSTGMGGPSATVVLADLAELGLRRAVRIGTCASLGDLELGDLLLVRQARAPSGEAAGPDEELTASLGRALPGAQLGVVVSLDDLHRGENDLPGGPAEAADMQTAALLAAARARGVVAGAVLLVTERAGGEQLGEETRDEKVKEAGRAITALL
jgi:uridine phosphorylase